MQIFITDTKTSQTLKDWIEERERDQAEMVQQAEFLDKQMKNLLKRKQGAWKKIWDSMQSEGLIPESYDYEDYNVHLNPDSGQLFIEKAKDKDPADLLRRLFSQL